MEETQSLYDVYENIKKKKTIVEKKENVDNDINIILLTNRNESKDDNLFTTARYISENCKKRNIPYYVLFIEDAYIKRDDSGRYTVHNKDDDKGFEVFSDKTVAISRGSIMQKRSFLNLLSQLERASIFCVNSRLTIESCADKYRTTLRLADAGIPTPKTALLQSMETIDHALEQIGNKFPCVVKTISGSKGVGVFFIESMRSLKSILQVIWKINEDEELLIQEYIESKYDIRVHVLGNEVIGSMKRFVIKNDFRSNYSQGGEVEKVELTEDQEKICIEAAKSVSAIWAGADLIVDKNGNNYIIEINSSPGTEGINKALGRDITQDILDFVSDKNHWIKVANEIGFKEIIEFDGVEMIAKFDTGNGSLCVIHSDGYEIDEKKQIVKWKNNGKEFKHKYKKIKEVHVGGLRDYTEKRPVVEIDIKFNGTVFKEVDFALDDRSGRTPMLINRRFMRKANVMVNPAKSFLVTKKPEEKKE